MEKKTFAFKGTVDDVKIHITLDKRPHTIADYDIGNDGKMKNIKYPVVIRVTNKNQRTQRNTGIILTETDYNTIANGDCRTKEKQRIRDMMEDYFDATCDRVIELKKTGCFVLSKVLKGERMQSNGNSKTLAVLWLEMAEEKKKIKTRDNYKQAYRSFFLANGAGFRMEGRRKVLTGRVLETMPDSLEDTMVQRWNRYMESCGNSASTKSIYLRVFRAVCRKLKDDNIIHNVPRLVIPKSSRRNDSFLTVPDILKLRDYQGPLKEYADWWIISYLCNGANMADIARLTWPDDCLSEFTFIRSKTEDKSPSTVHIPITSLLAPYLEKYASPRVKGERVFPQILLDAKTDRAMVNRIHDFLAGIREGLIKICNEIGIPRISASWARNSYTTTLTWHGISDKFIDDMVGHTDGSVLAGYQGKISPKKRMKINLLLFTNPEEDDDE